MKYLLLLCAIFASGTTFFINEAEARRLGGGRSVGIQRQAAPPQRATPPQATARPATANPQTPAASGLRKWGAPLAALAAGLGIAALLSHLGIGAEFAGLILVVIAAVLGFALLRRFMGGASKQSPQPAFAGAHGGDYRATPPQATAFNATETSSGSTTSEARWPAECDVQAFERQAKVNFIRLQAANDACNLVDIRDFTSPEMFAEIKLAIDERGCSLQKTDIIELNAEVLEVVSENGQYIASVRYSGSLREEANASPEAFDEIWHLSKPVDGNRGWVLAGIQQLS